MKRILLAAISAAALAAAVFAAQAVAHQSGCHSNHSCPSDRHTYAWANGGTWWSCAATYNSEYDASRDTTTFVYDAITYGCYSAGTYPVTPPPAEPTPTPSPTPTPAAPPPSQPAEALGICDRGRYADGNCTPGARFRSATARTVCKTGYTKRVPPRHPRHQAQGLRGLRHLHARARQVRDRSPDRARARRLELDREPVA